MSARERVPARGAVHRNLTLWYPSHRFSFVVSSRISGFQRITNREPCRKLYTQNRELCSVNYSRYPITVWVTGNRRLEREGGGFSRRRSSVDSFTTRFSGFRPRGSNRGFSKSSVPGYPHSYRVPAVVHGGRFSVLSIQFPTRFSVSDPLQSRNSVTNPFPYPRALTASATSLTCPSTFTFGKIFAIRPSRSIMTVVRTTPMYVTP